MISPSSDAATPLASLSGNFESNAQLIIFCTALIFAWAFIMANLVRDDEGLKLPKSFAANLFFGLSFVALYLALLVFAFLSPGFVNALNIPGLDEVPDAILKNVPLFVTIVIGGLYAVPQVKELVQRYAVFLHSAQYRNDDERFLQIHLENCRFLPSTLEVDNNKEYLQEFDVYIMDRETDVIKLDTVGSWRKVCTLLRILKDICRTDNSILSPRDCEELTQLENADRRKTRLAMNIIRMLDHLQQRGAKGKKLTEVSDLLDEVPHRDRDAVDRAETKARELIDDIAWDHPDAPQKPLRLSSRQMGEYLAQIEHYFITEYKMILRRLSALIAKMIIRSGDLSDDRLRLLKAAGFQGLGTVDQVNFDRVIWVLLTTWATVFAGFVLASISAGREMMQFELIASIALTVAVAALIGAMWGSRRKLIESRITPWSSYLFGGLLAIMGFIIVHGTRFLLDPKGTLAFLAKRNPEALNWGYFDYMGQILPWSITVFVLTICICRLARIDHWSWAKDSPLKERLTDGAITAVIYLCGGLTSLMMHVASGTSFGARILKMLQGEIDPTRLFFMQGQNLVVGFLIGALIIREVRRVAHSHVIEGTSVRPVSQPAERQNEGEDMLDSGGPALPAAG